MTAAAEFVDRVATVDELRALAHSVEWDDHYDWPTIGRSLSGSVHGVVATVDGRVVGMGRLVGDGAHYFYVQDVLVDPAHSDEGIATEIVSRLLARVEEAAPSTAFVGLFASDEARSVYETLGFSADDEMTGMHRSVEVAGRD
jgi:GNAT superfamily N-acetyltransferase